MRPYESCEEAAIPFGLLRRISGSFGMWRRGPSLGTVWVSHWPKLIGGARHRACFSEAGGFSEGLSGVAAVSHLPTAFRGVKVYDARLAAFMRTYTITHILTFNTADFKNAILLKELSPSIPGRFEWPTFFRDYTCNTPVLNSRLSSCAARATAKAVRTRRSESHPGQ